MTTWRGKDAPTGNIAENYQRFFVPTIGRPIAETLLAAVRLDPGERVLDVACGTGVLTRMAAERVGPTGVLAGLDINPGMLAVARASTRDDLAIEWHEASAEQMPLADAAFDVVLCQMGLQFVPDQPAALGQMHRVLVPGGRLALNAPGPTPELFAILDGALVRHVGEAVAGFVPRVFSLHDAGALKQLITDAGFGETSVRIEMLALTLPPPAAFLWQYLFSTPLAAAVGALDEAARVRLEREVVEGWQPFLVDGGMRIDVRTLTATARK